MRSDADRSIGQWITLALVLAVAAAGLYLAALIVHDIVRGQEDVNLYPFGLVASRLPTT